MDPAAGYVRRSVDSRESFTGSGRRREERILSVPATGTEASLLTQVSPIRDDPARWR